MSERFPGGAALRWLEEEFGGSISESESDPAVTAAAAVITSNDPDAVALIFMNLGVQDVFLGLSKNVSATAGLKLTAGGGSSGVSVRDDGTLPTREWYAVSPGGATQLHVIRIRLVSLSLGVRGGV
jgi:hypothetical protein